MQTILLVNLGYLQQCIQYNEKFFQSGVENRKNRQLTVKCRGNRIMNNFNNPLGDLPAECIYF